jgi:hypothetical protein
MKGDDKKGRSFNLLDVLLFMVVLSIGTLFISAQLFWYVGGVTAILFFIWLFIIWDDIVIWWSTRK